MLLKRIRARKHLAGIIVFLGIEIFQMFLSVDFDNDLVSDRIEKDDIPYGLATSGVVSTAFSYAN